MEKAKRVFLIFVILGFATFFARGEDPLASKELIQVLKQEISGERAFQYMTLISRYDRIQASEGWHQAALMIKEKLEKFGYEDAEIEGWPSNGSTYYYSYRTPIGWKAEAAELWMVSPRREKLCSYEEIPLTLVKHSQSADGEAELIDVGTGIGEEPYRNKDVKGKIVLATAYTGDVVREAVMKRGAFGVITWYPPEVRPGYPNMIRYTAIWPRWEERDKVGFGFNVSKRQGWLLKKMLERGEKVILKARVETEFYESKIEVLSASLKGRTDPDKEVMIIGHLCHPTPSANDNASGSGGMLEMARALRSMVDKGLVEPPRRTIRFLWVPEFYGTVPYIQSHLDRTRNTLSAINCDMIGEDLHLTGGTFNITCTPDSLPSYLNDVSVNFTELAERLNLHSISGSRHPFAYRVRPFSGGSDHYLFNDGSLRVPSVMFGHGDVFHHTNLDTPDKVDSSELRRVCFIALGTSYYLANASEKEAIDMARLIASHGLSRLSSDYYQNMMRMERSRGEQDLHEAYKHVLNVIEQAERREEKAILSTQVFVKDPSAKKELADLTSNIGILSSAFSKEAENTYRKTCQQLGVKPRKKGVSAEEKRYKRIIPVRLGHFICPLQRDYLQHKLGSEAVAKIKLRGNMAYEALNFVDGRKSILDITRAISAEFKPVDPQDVYDYFRVLEEAELIKLKSL